VASQPGGTSGRDRLATRLRKRVAAVTPRFLRGPLRAAHSKLLDCYFRLKAWIWRVRQERLPYDYLRGYLRENHATLDAIPGADLYYLHSYRQFPAVRRKARRAGAALIYDAHDSYRDITQVPVPGVPTALHRVERRCVREAASCSTTTGAMAGRLESRFGRKFEVVRNCQDSRLAEPAASDIRADARVPPDEFLVAMVANRKPGIAFETALGAMESVGDDVHLAFLGARYEREEALTATRGLEGRIHFLAPVMPTTVSSYIATADAAAVLYTSLAEGYVEIFLPNGLFYAVAAGLPLIYPRVGEIAATCDRYGLGLAVDPDDPHSIATALGRLRDESELLSSLRERVGAAQRELSWEHEEQLVARLVDKALADRAASAGRRAHRR